MPDFTAVFTEERDQWRTRAEAAEAELKRRIKVAARALVEWIESRDEWRERARRVGERAVRAEAEVERLRGALGGLVAEWNVAAEDEGGDLGGPTADAFYSCADDIGAVLRGDQ